MADMNNMTLPLPNPNDWLDHDGVAAALGVTRRTVDRLLAGGTINVYRIGTQRLFWRGEVETVRAARDVLARRG